MRLSHVRCRLAQSLLVSGAELLGVTLLVGCVSVTSRDPVVRMQALQTIKDQSRILAVAQGDPEPRVRKVAVSRLLDQPALASIAQHDVDQGVRTSAVARLENQAALGDLARSNQFFVVQRAAVEKLADQGILASLALDDACGSLLQEAAIKRLSDQEVLSHIAVKNSNSSIRNAAVARVNDQSLLRTVAANDGEDRYVRETAIKRMTESDAALAEIALGLESRSHDSVGRWVLQQVIAGVMTNQTLLTRLAKEGKIAAAARRISDPAVLNDLAINGASPEVQCDAIIRLMRLPSSPTNDYPTDNEVYGAIAQVTNRAYLDILSRGMGKHPQYVQQVLEIRRHLSDPDVVSRIGVAEMKVDYHEKSSPYYSQTGVMYIMKGGVLSVSVSGGKLDGVKQAKWETVFEKTMYADVRWIANSHWTMKVNTADLLNQLRGPRPSRLPPTN